jgi:adenosylhomocysteinase
MENVVVERMTRSQTGDLSHVQTKVLRHLADQPFVILDIGGYFADSFPEIADNGLTKLIGIVEDTENGHQKYSENLQILNDSEKTVPVYSVARSPLKEPEDHLVGEAVSYSVERILRENNSLITNKRALVIGYGKIGKSIANSLTSKNITVWVFDSDPIRRAQALSHGFFCPDRDYALERVEVIISATGQKSLKYLGKESECDFAKLRDNCFIASVTSADDEFDLGAMQDEVTNWEDGFDLHTFELLSGRQVHILNNGNAVNFAHNNTLGPYIYMVASEILACVRKILSARVIHGSGDHAPDIIELDVGERRDVAEAWMSYFRPVS